MNEQTDFASAAEVPESLPNNVIPFKAGTPRDREAVTPLRVVCEAGYLFEADWTEEALPTRREAWNYDDLGWAEQIELLLQFSYLSEEELAADYDLVKGPGGWSVSQLGEFEALFLYALEEPISAEELGPSEMRLYAPQRAGYTVLDALPLEECQRLGLYEVEGEQPDSDFCGVRFDGDVDALNATLRRHGANIVVSAA